MQTQKLVHDNNFKDVLMTERALNCMHIQLQYEAHVAHNPNSIGICFP